MVYNMRVEERAKKKRGRPPKKPVFDEILDVAGHQTSDESRDIAPEPPILDSRHLMAIRQSKHEQALKAQSEAFKHVSEKPLEEQENPEPKPAQEQEETLEELGFESGKNTFTIRFSRKDARRYSVTLWLNDSVEIRPSNYVGSKQANSFWSALKGAMK